VNLVDVNTGNVEQSGFFCMMSKKKSEGYKKKLAWLRARFDEGLRIKLLDAKEGGRGFIEYIPSEYAWRPVLAEGYMFIHCLWVVGQSKGKGYGRLLLDECLSDAQASGLRGVAILTSEGVWLVKKRFMLQQGFRSVGQAPPSFELLVKQFEPGPLPSLPQDWEERAGRYGAGLTVVQADQCPYIPDATRIVLEVAEARGIEARVVQLTSSRQVRESAPSPYGTFQIVYNGRLLSYHYLLRKDLEQKLDEAQKALES
jgi:GNAT superfamily N-acetyltransferase